MMVSARPGPTGSASAPASTGTSTTSASRSTRTALTVTSSGSPGPTPTPMSRLTALCRFMGRVVSWGGHPGAGGGEPGRRGRMAGPVGVQVGGDDRSSDVALDDAGPELPGGLVTGRGDGGGAV